MFFASYRPGITGLGGIDMIGTFVKKQLLLFVRNRHELLILLGMPFVLITILGFALGNIMDGNDGQPAVHAKIAFVNEGDEQQDIQKFTHEVEAMRMPENEKQLLIEAARSLSPITVLKQDVFGAKPLKKYIRIVDVPPAQLNKALQDDEYTAIVRLPDEFTYQMLKHLFFQQKQPTNLFFYVNEEKAWTSEIVGQIISEFQQHYSLVSALGKAGVKEFAIPDIHVNGKIETITKKEPIRAVTYYMIGMGVMFALYVASNVGSYAFEEKQSHVFDRMLLANVSKWSYMTGIFISAMLLSFFTAHDFIRRNVHHLWDYMAGCSRVFARYSCIIIRCRRLGCFVNILEFPDKFGTSIPLFPNRLSDDVFACWRQLFPCRPIIQFHKHARGIYAKRGEHECLLKAAARISFSRCCIFHCLFMYL